MPKPNGMLAMDYPPPKYQQVLRNVLILLISILFLQLRFNQIAFLHILSIDEGKSIYELFPNLKEHQIENLYRDFNTRLMDHTKKEVQIQESNYENISQQKFDGFMRLLLIRHLTYISI